MSLDAAVRAGAGALRRGRSPRSPCSPRSPHPGTFSTLAALVVTSVVLTTAALPLAGLLLRTATSARGGHRPGVDAIVVLGSTLEPDGRVPALLRSRLDRAVAVYRAEAAGDRAPLVVASGGMASAGLASQASTMVAYLEHGGVPAAHLVLEDGSTTTQENLLRSTALLAGRGPRARALVVTSDYHVWRTAALARRSGLDLDVVGARTPSGELPRALVREYALGLGLQGGSGAGGAVALAVACWLVLRARPVRRRTGTPAGARTRGAVLA